MTFKNEIYEGDTNEIIQDGQIEGDEVYEILKKGVNRDRKVAAVKSDDYDLDEAKIRSLLENPGVEAREVNYTTLNPENPSKPVGCVVGRTYDVEEYLDDQNNFFDGMLGTRLVGTRDEVLSI